MHMHDGTGRPIAVQGYAATFNTHSRPLECIGGKREIIRRGAFDSVLKAFNRDLVCAAYHLSGPGVFASVQAGSLDVWVDDHGLCFEASPVEATRVNRAIIAAIVSGNLRGCSWFGTPNTRAQTIDGERVQVIRSFHSLKHISLTGDPAYADTTAWCSHEAVDAMPPPLRKVVEHWHANRPTTRVRTVAANSGASLRRATARSRTPSGLAVLRHDDALEACRPPNYSLRDWRALRRLCERGQHLERRERNRMRSYEFSGAAGSRRPKRRASTVRPSTVAANAEQRASQSVSPWRAGLPTATRLVKVPSRE